MVGVVLVVLVLLALIPLFLIGAGVVSATLAQLLKRGAEAEHEASP